MTVRTWTNRPGFCAPILTDEPPDWLAPYAVYDDQVEIWFESDGEYDPGYRYDRNGDGQPPCVTEYRRDVTRVEVNGVELPSELHDAVRRLFYRQIWAAELEER